MSQLTLFHSARLKLTLTYIAIFLGISLFISSLFYYRTMQVLKSEYARMEQRLQLEINGQIFQGPRMMGRRIQPEDLELAQEKIILQLLYINGLIVFIVAVTGYILSGWTLRPIEQAVESQKQFIADAAHELRTPITAMKTSLEVSLMDKKLTKDTKSLLSENLNDVSSLENMVNQLLKLSQINHQPINLVPTALFPVITKSLKQVSRLAKAKSITITAKTVDQSLVVNGNAAALAELVTILLDNAIKYSPAKSTITLSTVTHRSSANLIVSDQGQGIEKQYLNHIFDRFYRADTSREKSNRHGGYGLGLAIAKRIVDDHHGQIHVQSKVGSGTVFTISLPKA